MMVENSLETDGNGDVIDVDEALDCDSDELEALEDAAELDVVPEEEVDKLVSDAETFFPPRRLEELMNELRRDGLVSFMRTRVRDLSQDQLKALLIALGILLPRQIRESNDIPSSYYARLLKIALVRLLRRREKLPQYSTVEDAVQLIRDADNILCLGGAGMSTSCGIPDFRSSEGIYAQLEKEGRYGLSEPQDMFDKDYFLQDPACFYSFAHKIFPSNFVPSPCHRFLKMLEEKGKLLRHYTQNIDTLENVAGIRRVLHCHGSFSKAQCTTPGCGYTVDGSEIKEDIFAKRVPQCPRCSSERERRRSAAMKKSNGRYRADSSDEQDDESDLPGLAVMKPCITFFGEKVTNEFDRCLLEDRQKVDLLIVIGTSLKVAPVSELVGHIPHSTPVILINRTPILHLDMDIQLLGDADVIVQYICRSLGWRLPQPEPDASVVGESSAAGEASVEGIPISGLRTPPDAQPQRIADSHFWLFPGAEADQVIAHYDGENDDDGDSTEGEDGFEEEKPDRKRSHSNDEAELDSDAKKARQ